jgi:hypothetical protein
MSDQAIIKDYDKPLTHNLERLERCLAGVSLVAGVQHRTSELFVSLFLESFADIPPSSEQVLNWSNWTHHTYFAVRTAAKLLGLICTFETMGRLDAVIQSLDEYPGVILIAEWETDSSSIFGEHHELDKLWTGADAHAHADAFLFTYCPADKLYDVTKKAVQFWQGRDTERQIPPSLFMTTVAYRKVKRTNEFVFIRTMEVKRSTVLLWHDLGFVSSEEYLMCIAEL